VVVHGHTPAEGPEVLPHRIGIDTGAVYGGALTCAVLEGDTVGFSLPTGGPPGRQAAHGIPASQCAPITHPGRAAPCA
jgi:hypothetical protein